MICEKPLVLNPWNLDALSELEHETGKRVYNVLQLRLHPAIRELRAKFREYLMESDWYGERLRTKQARDIALWTRHLGALERFRAGCDVLRGVDIDSRLAEACRQLARVSGHGYLKELEGTIGADPFFGMTGKVK